MGPDQAQIVKRLKPLRGCDAVLNAEVIAIFMVVYLFAIYFSFDCVFQALVVFEYLLMVA